MQRIGVFVCWCGSNIAGTVDVVAVAEALKKEADALAYAGGYYSIDGLPLSYYQRTDNEELAYNLMELVAREHIHLNNNNYSLLSGQMIGQNGNAISFGCNIRHNELYCIISASIAVISGTLDVTKMQEVTPYQVAELTIIDSPLELSSGSRVGSGNNEVIQFSNDAGNAKRVYELETATLDDLEDSYVLIDKSSLPTARRVPISSLGGGAFDKAFQVHYNPDGTIKSIQALASLWTDYDLSAGGEGGGDIPGGITEVTAQMITDALGYTPISPSDTLPNPYALVINGQRYDGSSEVVVNISGGGTNDWNAIINKPTTLSGYGITDALSTSGGTISGGIGALHIYRNDEVGSFIGFSGIEGNLGYLGFRNSGRPGFFDANWNVFDIIHSGNIGSYKSGSADYISNSTYYYDGNVLTNDVSANYLFGNTPTDNRMFPAFMQNHPTWSGWADVAHFTGYCMYGATQLATEYNAISPRVAIRKYNQTNQFIHYEKSYLIIITCFSNDTRSTAVGNEIRHAVSFC